MGARSSLHDLLPGQDEQRSVFCLIFDGFTATTDEMGNLTPYFNEFFKALAGKID
jgi:hypothetical protein